MDPNTGCANRKEFALTLDSAPQSDTLLLETQNGDNPPIDLENFQLFYPATRVLFKTQPADNLFLYYGNPEAGPPHYDLSLVANELLAADKSVASLGTEEPLRKPAWRESATAGKGGVVFWGILALVVVVLLVDYLAAAAEIRVSTAQIGALHLRILAQRGRVVLQNDPARLQHVTVIGNFQREIRVLFHQQNRDALLRG